MKPFKHMAVVALLLQALSVSGASCQKDVPASTPAERFSIRNDLVEDHQTTLTWMRCALGQIWQDGACTGAERSLSLGEAQTALDEINHKGLAGYHDWRLPLLPELASIVERQCFYPRANETVFPGIHSVVFWSGMHRHGSEHLAYALDFGSGKAMVVGDDHREAIRLVRGGPWWHPPATASSPSASSY